MSKAKLTIAISSRALFDLDEANTIYDRDGLEAYAKYQLENEGNILKPGVAFPLVRKLLALNTDPSRTLIEVILLSQNSAETGLRVFNSIQHYGLAITRAAFSSGQSVAPYVKAFGAQLFLSANAEDVRRALETGIAAAFLLPHENTVETTGSNQLRIAFDGDAVIFSDEAEKVFKEGGLEAFTKSETASADTPLPSGPFKDFLSILHEIQSEYPPMESPIRTALITARAAPAHERVVKTLRAWGIRIDEALFLGGRDKSDYLKAFGADIFFDDQTKYCIPASKVVPTGHVPYGIVNSSKL